MNGQNKEEKETKGTKSDNESQEAQCCCPEGMAEMMAKCCEGMGAGGPESMAGIMAKCCDGMKKAYRWFPLIPVVLAGTAFALGYFLSPGTVRLLWLVASGTVVVLGLTGFILMGSACRA